MQIDTLINAIAQQMQSPALTLFSKFIAILFDPISILTISLILATALYIKNKKSQATLLFSTTIITGAIIKLSKTIFQRVRPENMLITETNFSFPSGHATIAVVFFGLLAYLFTKGKSTKTKITTYIITTLIILIIAATRLYLRVHWMTDILGGLILGTIILTASILIYKKF